MTKGDRKANFEVRAASKKNAMKNLQKDNPGWNIHIVESYKKRK